MTVVIFCLTVIALVFGFILYRVRTPRRLRARLAPALVTLDPAATFEDEAPDSSTGRGLMLFGLVGGALRALFAHQGRRWRATVRVSGVPVRVYPFPMRVVDPALGTLTDGMRSDNSYRLYLEAAPRKSWAPTAFGAAIGREAPASVSSVAEVSSLNGALSYFTVSPQRIIVELEPHVSAAALAAAVRAVASVATAT